jgi:hypothetical protein
VVGSVRSSLQARRFYVTSNCPNEAEQLSSYGRDCDLTSLASTDELSIAAAQTDLCLPGNVFDSLRNRRPSPQETLPDFRN